MSWPVACRANEPLASWRGNGSVTLEGFGLHDLGEFFGAWSPWRGLKGFFGTAGPGEAKFVRKTTKPGEFVFLVFGDLFGPQSPRSDWL